MDYIEAEKNSEESNKETKKKIEKPSGNKKKAHEKLQNFHDYFMVFFSNHIVCSLIALVWAPYVYTIILFVFNLVFFLAFCVAEVLEKKVHF